MLRLSALLLALAACPASAPPASTNSAPPPPPSDPVATPPETPVDQPVAEPGDACTADSDCVVTNFAGCCACPGCEQGAPTARSVTALADAQKQCAVVRCNMDRCKTMMCRPGEPADQFTAKCDKGVCTAVHK